MVASIKGPLPPSELYLFSSSSLSSSLFFPTSEICLLFAVTGTNNSLPLVRRCNYTPAVLVFGLFAICIGDCLGLLLGLGLLLALKTLLSDDPETPDKLDTL